jgi:hypothetical protein
MKIIKVFAQNGKKQKNDLDNRCPLPTLGPKTVSTLML